MSYYKVTSLIRETALNGGIITTVTHGELGNIDLKRQTIFPLLHIVPQTFNNDQKTVGYSFVLYFLDLVDWNNENYYDEAEPFRGTDNLIDVFHNMSIAAQMFMDEINRGAARELNFEIQVPNSGSFVSNRFENLLSGVEIALTITTPNTSVTDGIC